MGSERRRVVAGIVACLPRQLGYTTTHVLPSSFETGLSFDVRSGNLGGDEMDPIATIEEAIRMIAEYQGAASDFHLPIADSLQDPMGLNMAVITDAVLARGFMPDGFEQKDGYRIYKYKALE